MVRARKACLRCGNPKEPGSRRKFCDTCRKELPTHKVCSKCGIKKPANDFYVSRGKEKGLSSQCATCLKQGARNSQLKRLYGITMDEYIEIKESQDGKCAICQRATGTARALAVDHDHKIEEQSGLRASVRGLLCSKCNDLLGHVRDDPATLLRAIDYLNAPPARNILKEI